MIPTNINKTPPGSGVSSNLVIWQGPDIECLKLCKGDSITDITFKLATELCEILDMLKVENYDLSCFNVKCPDPQNFEQLLQFIIARLCKVYNCTIKPGCDEDCKEVTATSPGCPDCVVNIASCFQFKNELGDLVTTMQLDDYVHAIGNKICDIISRVDNNDATINNIDERLKGVEDCCNQPDPTIEVPTSCLMEIPPRGLPIVDFVTNLENEFCALKAATGTPI